MLSHWNCLLHFGICSIFPKGNGSEYNQICCHEKNKVNQEKHWKPWTKQKIQRTEDGGKGRETAEKGGKTAEKDGLWKLRSKSCRKTCPQGVFTDFDSFSFFPVVKLCWKLQFNWPNGDVSQRLKCATMNTYLLYCRVCFLHCCSGGVYYIGKSWEILSSMCGCLSGVWSLVVSFATAKVAMGSPIAFVNSCVWGVFFFQRRFWPTRGKRQLMRRYYFASGAWGTFFCLWCFYVCLCCMCSCHTVSVWFSSCDVSKS